MGDSIKNSGPSKSIDSLIRLIEYINTKNNQSKNEFDVLNKQYQKLSTMNKSFNDSAFIECEKGREILYKTQIDLKKQITKLSPFIHNGQINSSVLLAGDHAELTLTFYSGQTYRILVSSQDVLGDVFFLMKDASKGQLFSSKEILKLNALISYII